jgi:hypothetical protein
MRIAHEMETSNVVSLHEEDGLDESGAAGAIAAIIGLPRDRDSESWWQTQTPE